MAQHSLIDLSARGQRSAIIISPKTSFLDGKIEHPIARPGIKCDDFFIAADECEIRDAAHVEKGDRARLADLLGKSGVIDGDKRRALSADGHIGLARSEEHTSELQSLMRIPYAVFCLKT